MAFCLLLGQLADAQQIEVSDTASRCIDYANLTAPGTLCYYGTYNAPRNSRGVVDNGPSQMSSRHTVNRTPGQTDPRTGSNLPLIPPGEAASVRLGNWNNGSEAEQIEYTFTPAPYANTILVLKYAVVCMSAGPYRTPEFSMQITDAQGQSLGTCTETTVLYTDCEHDTTWHQQDANNNVWWKEWTEEGFNLSAFAGQTLKVRLTTQDGGRAANYGYAYFTLNCAEAQISGLSCGNDPDIAVKAPDGFNYEWSLKSDTTHTVFSRAQILSADSIDTATYVCVLTSKIDSGCSFGLETSLLPRSPHARFAPLSTPDGCRGIVVAFSNISTVTTILGVTTEKPAYYEWSVVDSLTNDTLLNRAGAESPTVKFPNEDCDYIIELVAGLGGGQCADTMRMLYHVAEIYVEPDTIYEEICGGRYYRFNGQKLYYAGEYDALSADGCDSLHLVLTVIDKVETEIYDTIAAGETYDWNGISLSRAGTYKAKLTSPRGCDSIVTLHLTVLTGVDEVAAESLIRVVPNPANAGQPAQIFISSTEPIVRVEVINSLGSVVSVIEPDTIPINLTSPAVAGVYYVRVTTNDGRVAVTKLIVE